jgi:hypothetical protein
MTATKTQNLKAGDKIRYMGVTFIVTSIAWGEINAKLETGETITIPAFSIERLDA